MKVFNIKYSFFKHFLMNAIGDKIAQIKDIDDNEIVNIFFNQDLKSFVLNSLYSFEVDSQKFYEAVSFIDLAISAAYLIKIFPPFSPIKLADNNIQIGVYRAIVYNKNIISIGIFNDIESTVVPLNIDEQALDNIVYTFIQYYINNEIPDLNNTYIYLSEDQNNILKSYDNSYINVDRIKILAMQSSDILRDFSSEQIISDDIDSLPWNETDE